MVNSIWVYRIFDITDEINLHEVEKVLSPGKPTSRVRLSRVRPKSIHIDNPPVTVELGQHRMSLNGTVYSCTATSRIFDLGVISIVLKIQLPDDITFEQLHNLSVFLYQTEELEPVFENFLSILKTSLKIVAPKARGKFVEDFTIYFFQRWNHEWDPVPLLLAEKEPLSQQTVKDTLKNSFSYGQEDLTIITWDSALVYDSEGSTDIPDLFEFATTQLLELRYYDDLLSKELDRMYDSIDRADKEGWWIRLREYRKIMKNIMEVITDISEITERIQKQITVTEDVFYARVYGSALTIFRTKEWMESIKNKVDVILRNYSMLNDEVLNHRSTLLELAIVALFILEVAFGLLGLY